MSLVASIRVNMQLPFPALVRGANAVVVSKQNGVWTVSLNVGGLATSVPVATDYGITYLLVYNALTATYTRVALNSLGIGGARAQRSVTASPITIAVSDQILNLNLGVAANIALPAATTRNGVPLTFKDVGGKAGTFNILLVPNGAETIDGLPNYTLNVNRQAVTLVPFNDGTNVGWFIL